MWVHRFSKLNKYFCNSPCLIVVTAGNTGACRFLWHSWTREGQNVAVVDCQRPEHCARARGRNAHLRHGRLFPGPGIRYSSKARNRPADKSAHAAFSDTKAAIFWTKYSRGSQDLKSEKNPVLKWLFFRYYGTVLSFKSTYHLPNTGRCVHKKVRKNMSAVRKLVQLTGKGNHTSTKRSGKYDGSGHRVPQSAKRRSLIQGQQLPRPDTWDGSSNVLFLFPSTPRSHTAATSYVQLFKCKSTNIKYNQF